MKKLIIISISAFALLMSSCTTKTSAISDLRTLTYDIRTYGSEYTVEDWRKVKNEYDKIQDRLNRYDYTPAQREEIGDLKGQCVKYFAKGVITNAAVRLSVSLPKSKGILKGIKR